MKNEGNIGRVVGNIFAVVVAGCIISILIAVTVRVISMIL